MKIKSLEKSKEFIPEFNGNKDLDKKDQIIVNIKKFPGIEEIGKIKAFKYDANGNVIINYNDDYILKNCVGSIKNLELEDGIEPVTNGASLSKSSVLELEPLVTEIRTFLLETAEVVTEGEN